MARQNSLVIKLPYAPSLAPAINRATQAGISKGSRAAESPLKQVVPAKITSHFSQSQLALALAIQKAKPEALSTSEYCQQLRKSIKTGQPVIVDGLRYVDTCEFWKDQYTKIYLENKALEDKIHMLEHGRQKLLMNLHDQADLEIHEITSSRALEGFREVGPMERGPSRKRPSSTVEDIAGDQGQEYIKSSSSEENCMRMSTYVLRIGRQRSNLEKAAKDSSTLDHVNVLAKNIIQTLITLESTLTNTCLPLKLLRSGNEDHRSSMLIQQIMHQVKISYMACFKSTTELCLTIPGRARMAEIVYRMVIFFKKALKLLHTLGELQVEYEAAQACQKPRHKRSRLEEREYIVSKTLAASLASIAHDMEWKGGQCGHADLLEGMLFCIMEQTGRLLSEAVFAEHVATSDNPGNISKLVDPVPSSSIEHESRYMVQILQAALRGTTRRKEIAQVLDLGTPSLVGQAPAAVAPRSSASPADLLSKAKKLLQSTLVKSAVGGHYLETLRLPTPPMEEAELTTDVDEEIEEYGTEWLIHSLWGIIGWDMIA